LFNITALTGEPIMKHYALIIVLAAAAPASAATNLITNGGFELPVLPIGGLINVNAGQVFPGWSVSGGTIGIPETASHDGLQYYTSHTGRNSLDLSGNAITGNKVPTNAITQTVATVAGKKYLLNFFVGNAGPYGTYGFNLGLPTTVRVAINGGSLQSFTNADETPYVINYKPFGFSFIATGPTTIKFQNGPNNDGHVAIDDITLMAAVPEPATWAMLIAGFGLVGGAARRRRGALALAKPA
jgi:hypothetical protein